jgi:hypothetical protein
MRPIVFVLSMAAVYPLWAADIETQHAFDVTLPLKPRLELILHSRIRTQAGGLGFYQTRAGPIVSWDVTPRISLLSGYYYARQERKVDNDFVGGHRLFGGAEIAVVETRRLSIDQRLLAERFLSDATDDFDRYRSRTRLSAKGSIAPYTSHEFFFDARGWRTIAPYTSHEFFFDARGWRSNRHSTGIRWSALPAVQIDLGYLYEHRRAGVGPDRHMWLTSIHWKKSSRRADPDM